MSFNVGGAGSNCESFFYLKTLIYYPLFSYLFLKIENLLKKKLFYGQRRIRAETLNSLKLTS